MEPRLQVGNLPPNTNHHELVQLFTQAGAVRSTSLTIDRVTGRAKSVAYVEMSSLEEAKVAIRMFHGKDFHGHVLTVKRVRRKAERQTGGLSGDSTTAAPPPDQKKGKGR